MALSILTLGLTFLAGLASVLSPCVFPVLAIVVTGTESDHKLRPLLVVAGLTVTFMAMGIATSLFGSLIGPSMLYVEKIGGALIVVFGILMLLDINVFKKLTFLQQLGSHGRGKWSGLFLGLTLGIVWIPCVGPMLSSVLARVATDGQLGSGVVLLGVYSIGFSVPMLIVGYSSKIIRDKLRSVGKAGTRIRLASGAVIIMLGLSTIF